MLKNVCTGSGRTAEPPAITREGAWGWEGQHKAGFFQEKHHTTGENQSYSRSKDTGAMENHKPAAQCFGHWKTDD